MVLLVLLLLIGGLGFAAGIMIRIHKDGRETAVEVPEGSTTRIGADGGVEVELSGTAKTVINPAADWKALQGPWRVRRIEMGNDAETIWQVPGQGAIAIGKIDRLDFGDNYLDLVSLRDGSCQTLVYRIDPAASPKTINIFDQGRSGTPGETFALGNYDVHNSHLFMRLARFLPAVQGDQRPKGLEGKPASGDVLLFLERYRPSKEEQAFLGNWAVAGVVIDGKAVGEQQIRSQTARFGGMYFNFGDFAAARQFGGVWRLEASSQPKTITLFKIITAEQREQFRGLYKFDGDRLTIAYRQGDSPPEKFESKPGSGVTLLVLKRTEPPKRTGGASPSIRLAPGVIPNAQKPQEAPLQFGPVKELVITAKSEHKGNDALDLATGKLLDLPKDFDKWPADKQGKWFADNNVDLFVDVVLSAGTYPVMPQRGQLVPEGLKLAAIANERWDNATDEKLRAALASITPGTAVITPGHADMPVAEVHERRGTTYFDIQWAPPITFAFQTRKGARGILQILRYTEEPRGMRIRYKLVQQPAANPSGLGMSAVNPAAELKALQGRWKVVRVEKGKNGETAWANICEFPLTLDPGTTSRFDFGAESGEPLTIRRRVSYPGPYPGRPGVANSQGFLPAWWSQGFDYRIDPTKEPTTIDILNGPAGHETGAPPRLAALGIYDIQGDEMKLCVTGILAQVVGNQRPKDFSVAPDSGDILFVLKRYKPSEDGKAIQGGWAIVSQTEDGKPASKEQLRYHLPVVGITKDGLPIFSEQYFDRAYWFHNGFVSAGGSIESVPQGPYDLDATKSPKEITIYWFKNGYSVNDVLGIYKFDGDRLTIAYRQNGPRPDKFKSNLRSGVRLLVLERAKPATSSKPVESKKGESRTPPRTTKPLTTTDGKPDKQAVLSLLRKSAARQADVMRSGQVGITSTDNSWRFGMGEKFNASPSTTNMQGKVCFDGYDCYCHRRK